MGQSLDHIWYCRTRIAKQFVALTLRGTVKGDDQMIWSHQTNSSLAIIIIIIIVIIIIIIVSQPEQCYEQAFALYPWPPCGMGRKNP